MKCTSGVSKPRLGSAYSGDPDLRTLFYDSQSGNEKHWTRSPIALSLSLLSISKPLTDVFKSLTFEDCFGLLPHCVYF